jgi:hypothetical protein
MSYRWEEDEVEFKTGDLVEVISIYKDVVIATGIYLGIDEDEMYIKILTNDGKTREFDLTFYYLERL